MDVAGVTSVDVARLAGWLAWDKCDVTLGKTQMQKILFICYGVWLANKSGRLFDERPAAWPFGPVFPRVYVWYSARKPKPMTSAEVEFWRGHPDVTQFVWAGVRKLCRVSARRLTEWSHRPGGPWRDVALSNPWGKVIPDDRIRTFFKGDWFVGL